MHLYAIICLTKTQNRDRSHDDCDEYRSILVSLGIRQQWLPIGRMCDRPRMIGATVLPTRTHHNAVNWKYYFIINLLLIRSSIDN